MPPKGGINHLSYACNGLYIANLLQVLAYILYILHIVYVNPECTLEYSIVALNVHLLYVGI